MATGVEELVDMLFAMIDEAKSVPLSSEKCIIERDKDVTKVLAPLRRISSVFLAIIALAASTCSWT